MRIRVSHRTSYRYEAPARGLIQLLRMTPRAHEGQHVVRWRCETEPDTRLRQSPDSFGNAVTRLDLPGSVEAVTILVEGEVVTADTAGVVRGTEERFPPALYLRRTPLTEADEAIRTYAEAIRAEVGAGGALAVLHALNAGLHGDIAFDTDPTNAGTTAAQAFAMRRGVCQDLTQIFIASARHLEIPARYVSGYFHRSDGVVNQEAGHAWAEAFVPGLGWIAFDPSNGICATEAHIRVAVALDYLGAAPVRGSRSGGGGETLEVGLRVAQAGPAGGQAGSEGRR